MVNDTSPTLDPADAAPGSYLHDLIDGATAATLLGVSPARWRQISGPRSAPNPLLPPHLEAGVRGARWSVRDLYRYALSTNRPLTHPTPPLAGLDEPRYQLVRSAGRELVLRPAGHLEVRVWGQVFAPTAVERCGHGEAPLLLVTPLMGTAPASVVGEWVRLVREVLAVPGWGEEILHRETGATVAVLTGRGDGLVQVLTVGEETISDIALTGSLLEAHGQASHATAYLVPGGDVADCLGWEALPWWAGAATAELCAQWRPGHTVETSVPLDLVDQALVAAWIATQTPRHPATAADLAGLSRLLDPARHHDPECPGEDHVTDGAPDGFAPAVVCSWQPCSPEEQRDARPMLAVDQVLDRRSTPSLAAAVVRDLVGDPVYAPPMHYPRASIPKAWHKLLFNLSDDHDVAEWAHSPRWDHLLAVHHEAVDSYDSDDVHGCKIMVRDATGALVASCRHGLTVAPLSGYVPLGERAGVGYEPASTLRLREYEGLAEVLLLPALDGRLGGWARTDFNRALPMPAPATSSAGLGGTAGLWVSALRGRDDDFTLAALRAGCEHRDPVQDLLATAVKQPRVVPVEDLRDAARRTFTIYRPGATW